MRSSFFHSLIWRLLLPVIIFGTLFSLVLGLYLVPPLVSSLEKRIDKTIDHTVSMAMKICEERLNDMLDLRMEENEEMNTAARKEAIEEIKQVAGIFPHIRMMVFDENGLIHGASLPIPAYIPEKLLQSLEKMQPVRNLYATEIFGRRVFLAHGYFPFWRWHIVSFIPEDDYLEPIIMAKRIVFFGNFGTLLAVAVSLILLFMLSINLPLKKIISTTRNVRRGTFDRVNLQGSSEIEQVAVAFDEMISKLEDDKKKIDSILKELSDSEEKYRILSENSLALVLVATRNRFRYANRTAGAFFQRQVENLYEAEISFFFDDDQAQILRQRIETLISGNSHREHFELCCRMPDGGDKWLEVLASPIPYQGESAVLIHALDITRRKQMESEQESLRQKINRGEQMKMLGTLAGGVAHDLNNILSGIVSYPELLLQDLDDRSSLYQPLQIVQQSGVKAAAIVQDLLTLTRRGVVISEVINIADILDDYLNSLECKNLLSTYPGIDIIHRCQADIMNIKGSSHHLSKSIMNLVTNAAEAMPHGGEILIEVENRYVESDSGSLEDLQEGHYVTVSVSDTGEGISEEDLSKIFEPFYTRKIMGRSGTGLGMSVVWGTVKDHRGHIDVRSEKNRGTTFTLYFPASRAPLTASATPAVRHQGRGQRILVVDDAEEQRLIASSMLRSLGYSADTASSGEEAVALLHTQKPYDLVFLDMIMEPGMDGLDTYRQMLEITPGQKAIIASGFSETLRVRNALSIGAGTYLKKPYDLEALATALHTVLSDNAHS